MKKLLQPDTWLFPLPVVLVTCQSAEQKPNIITLAWCGVVASNPPAVGLGIRPSRYSHSLIEQSKEFVVNIPTQKLLDKVDWCGMVSGKNFDKFKETSLTPLPAKTVGAPLIKECPVNLECKLIQSLSLGTHTLFLGEITALWVNEEALDSSGKIMVDKLELVSFVPGADQYFALGKKLGDYGLSRKRK